MDLARYQRDMVELLRGTFRVQADSDPHLVLVAASRDLEEARGNVRWWRVYVLDRTCPLTTRLLRQLGRFEEDVDAFVARCNISPFRETQAPMFLELVIERLEGLARTVARFELARLRVVGGDPAVYRIGWSVEPLAVLHALAVGEPVPSGLARVSHVIVFPGGGDPAFRIEPGNE